MIIYNNNVWYGWAAMRLLSEGKMKSDSHNNNNNKSDTLTSSCVWRSCVWMWNPVSRRCRATNGRTLLIMQAFSLKLVQFNKSGALWRPTSNVRNKMKFSLLLHVSCRSENCCASADEKVFTICCCCRA